MRTEREILNEFERLGFIHRVDDIFEVRYFELIFIISNVEYLTIRVDLVLRAYTMFVYNNEPLLMSVEIHGLLAELFKSWGWLE